MMKSRQLVIYQVQKKIDSNVMNADKNEKITFEFSPKIMDTKSVTGHHQGYIAETVDFSYSLGSL